MILTTHTFSSNSNTITFLYLIAFAQMQSSKEFVRPFQSRTPGKAYPAARLYILICYNWLWLRQLLRHEKLSWVWRRIRVGRLCCYCCYCCTPRDRILSTQTFFGTHLHLILSTQTFSSNPLAPYSYYTNFFLQPLCT